MSLAGTYSVQETDTAVLTAGESTDFWAEHVCRNHGTLGFRFAAPATFRGGTIVQRHIGYQLVDFWSDGIVYTRSPKDVREDGDESLRLLVPTLGTLHLSQDDISTRIAPGQAALVTKARPFDLEHSGRTRAWVMSLPSGVLPPGEGADGAPLDLGQGLGAVVGSMITQLGAQRRSLDAAGFSLVYDRIIELLGLCLNPRPELPDTLAAVDAAVRDYVRRHAADPALTPGTIARSLGWSLRQVQLALHRTGTTPAGLLRTARLDLAHRLLRDAPAGRTVADIAHASGFRSLSAFGTSFKARFGVTPQEARMPGAMVSAGGDAAF
ncbi:helix-turn-helix domain-containing protein [Streptomyces sp. NPDC051985]|uniref:helix-turn-helix domain-containing protein n=1 Tax=Streptomyces sp. NPDC051985 TaxID=3155807 RepID=UPI003433F56A